MIALVLPMTYYASEHIMRMLYDCASHLVAFDQAAETATVTGILSDKSSSTI
jgi:hypothetical protein